MEKTRSETETLEFEDLTSQYLTLRIGEMIPRLTISRIKKITNQSKPDNLPGTDYKYVLEDENGKALVVNSWSLWRKVNAALRESGRINAILELKHNGVDSYSVRVIED